MDCVPHLSVADVLYKHAELKYLNIVYNVRPYSFPLLRGIQRIQELAQDLFQEEKTHHHCGIEKRSLADLVFHNFNIFF